MNGKRPDVDLGRAEPRGVLGDDQVARERDAERAGEDVPGRGDDRGLAELAELPEDLDEGLRRRSTCARSARRRAKPPRLPPAEKTFSWEEARTTTRASSSSLTARERVEELGQELVGERVSRLGIVQRDRRDAVGDVELDLLVGGHRASKKYHCYTSYGGGPARLPRGQSFSTGDAEPLQVAHDAGQEQLRLALRA